MGSADVKMTLYLITTCVKQKTKAGPSISKAKVRTVRNLNSAIDIGRLYETWHAMVGENARASYMAPAYQVYDSRLWRLFRIIYENASQRTSVQHWVVSAGLGFFNAEESICGYGASFSESADSVYDDTNVFTVDREQLDRISVNRLWWNQLIADPPLGRERSPVGSIHELLPILKEQDHVLMIGSRDYFDSLHSDLSETQGISTDRIAFVGLQKESPRLPQQFRESVRGYGDYRAYQRQLASLCHDILAQVDPQDPTLKTEPKELTHGLAGYHLLVHFLEKGDWNVEFE